jgi:uncharacterized membrane protein YfcA
LPLALLFGVISLLYATVGQAGGTAFLALMAFVAFPSAEMRPTALALNIVAATYSTWVFNREKVVDWQKLRPLLLSSLPTALAGAFIVLDESVYKTTTGIVLLLAGAAMILRRQPADNRDRETPLLGAVSVGAVVGLVSGLTGVGGGVFLAPTLIALHWASPKQTAALSAPFILANSAVGLIGVLLVGSIVPLRPLRAGRAGRRHRRYSDRPEMAKSGRYAARSRGHPSRRRDSIGAFLIASINGLLASILPHCRRRSGKRLVPSSAGRKGLFRPIAHF